MPSPSPAPPPSALRRGPSGLALFVALSLLVGAAVAPALGGDWVYDDRMMPGHPAMDGTDDLLAAFGRSSQAYQRAAGARAGVEAAGSYRPFSMASLILPLVLWGPRPLPQHTLSLALHLATLGALVLLAQRRGRVSWPAAGVLAAFALHPAFVEAYGWINGRSDVLAGAALAACAALLAAHPGAPGWRRWLGLVALLILGACSKETFLPAAAGLLLAHWLRPQEAGDVAAGSAPAAQEPGGGAAPLRTPRAGLALAAAWGLAAAAALGGRALTGGAAQALGGATWTGALLAGPRLLALGAASLLVPLPEPMRLLAWELAQPWRAAEVAGLAALGVLTLALARRRRWAALALLSGACAALLPVGLVAGSFWLGFDRYLYLPGVLLAHLALSALPGPAPTGSGLRAAAGGPAGAALGAALASLALAGLAWASWQAALPYRSHDRFVAALAEARPADPSGWLLAAARARQQGDTPLAGELLAHLPTAPQPPALEHRMAQAELQLGRSAAAAQRVERAAARWPEHAGLRLDLLGLRVAQGRVADAAALLRALPPGSGHRAAAQALLAPWLEPGALPPERQAALRRALEEEPPQRP